MCWLTWAAGEGITGGGFYDINGHHFKQSHRNCLIGPTLEFPSNAMQCALEDGTAGIKNYMPEAGWV